MVTRMNFVAKKSSFRASKRRREVVSSPKSKVSVQKTTTRRGLVAKNEQFLAQNGDEKRSRRQKSEFSAPKW
ncbi:hypothetical protein [Caldibacillus thermoamylovorans]|uniref:hypothetical protein n=1 Tax=Caldibacillus thermoamylovorans TaxID=35841 RepID=UPI00126A564A|nr:hypothetical protein [Caldibacillus thermoamylovorans]